MLFSAPKSPGLKPCDSLPFPKHATSRIPQGLGWSWPECWLPKRSSLFAFQSFVNQSWLEVLESWLPLCTAVLYFIFFYYHHRFNHKRKRKFIISNSFFKSEKPGNKPAVIKTYKFNHSTSVRKNIRPHEPSRLSPSPCSNTPIKHSIVTMI